jgi:hypothetical protein
MNSRNKRYIIFFVAIIIIFIIFISVVFFQTPKQQSATLSQNQNSASAQKSGGANSSPSAQLPPPSSNPQTAAQQFYTYFFSSAQNPLANGAYKNNPYLSPEFKSVVGGLYGNGNTPVFCPGNKRANIVVGKEQDVYYNNSYLKQEVISEAPPGSKDLYTMLLENVNGKWLVFDINCD